MWVIYDSINGAIIFAFPIVLIHSRIDRKRTGMGTGARVVEAVPSLNLSEGGRGSGGSSHGSDAHCKQCKRIPPSLTPCLTTCTYYDPTCLLLPASHEPVDTGGGALSGILGPRLGICRN